MIGYGEISSWRRKHQIEQEVWLTELLNFIRTLAQHSRCINWTNYSYNANKTEYTLEKASA